MDRFLPGRPWRDANGVPVNAHGGGVLWHEGTYYGYGEHKVAGPPGNTAQVGVHVYAVASGCTGWAPNAARSAVADAKSGGGRA